MVLGVGHPPSAPPWGVHPSDSPIWGPCQVMVDPDVLAREDTDVDKVIAAVRGLD